MANSYYEKDNVIAADADDILTFYAYDDADSGLKPIWIDKIYFKPNSTTDGVQFGSLDTASSATLSISNMTTTVGSTYRITDAASGASFNGASAGDWVHIKKTSTDNNLGWYLITGVDGSNQYIDVAYGTRALSNESNKVYSMDIYTPKYHTIIVAETGDSGAQAIKPEWIQMDRRFPNLAMYALSASAYCRIYIK